MPIHTTNFEPIKSLILQDPVQHLPACTSSFNLESDSSAKHVASVLYKIQNVSKHVIAFYSATMPDATCSYSSSELELFLFEKITPAFSISVEIFDFHCPNGPQCLKTDLLFSQACENESYTDFSFGFQQISGKHMFVSDFLSRFSSDKRKMNQSHISQILHYLTTPHICLSWMLSASLTITRVRVYVLLTLFQLQGLTPNFRKLQFQVYLHQA